MDYNIELVKDDSFVIILSAVGTKDGTNSDVELVFN